MNTSPQDLLAQANRHTQRLAALRAKAVTCGESATRARAEIAMAEEVSKLLLAAADSQRDKVRRQVEATVNAAVQAVFGPQMSFRLEVELKRGTVGVVPEIGYLAAHPPRWVSMQSVGGGVVDVVSFALRVAVLCGLNRKRRPTLICDEPFKHVSAGYLPAVADMVSALVKQTGLQLLIVTHEPEIVRVADTAYRITMVDGSSIVNPQQPPAP